MRSNAEIGPRSSLLDMLLVGMCCIFLDSGARTHAAPPSRSSTQAALVDGQDPLRRESAALALGAMGDRSAVTTLIDRLEHDSDPWVRAGAANALGQIGSRDAIRPLRVALGREDRERVRREIAKALLRLGQRAGLLELMWQIRSGTHYAKAEVMDFLASSTGQSFGETAASWWRYLAETGYLKLARRPFGTPAFVQLTGAGASGSVKTSAKGPWLSATRTFNWRQECAQVIDVHLSNRDLTPEAFAAAMRARGGVGGQCILIFNIRGLRDGAQAKNAPRLVVRPKLIDLILMRYPKIPGIAVSGLLETGVKDNEASRSRMVEKSDRVFIEQVGELDRVIYPAFRLLIVPQETPATPDRNASLVARQRVLLLAVFP